ncbi:RmlC-like cupin domain-containing protein [Ampelomyces quisqualis]|uniref:RmlC-like cupin domain-containing protein n=1 Tax=Ampelomyces quisqualis TaxID=50730 RepID=A0A6A5QD28_AMPQU|nr:RmlC-like cupin domain-containing protein [Ampelomyces quisqualis]
MTDTSNEQQHAATTNSFFTIKAFTAFVALLAVTVAFSSSFRNNLSAAFSKPTTRTMSTSASMKITKRPWSARGKADHGWLYSFHTFSFASYYDVEHESFGPLRVINEDRVKPGTGFGTHSHSEFGIFSYIVSGVLEHKDSMGNLENLKRGEVQFTNAGTGIRHSEYNRNKDEEVHFLQIWAKPNKSRMEPHYETKLFTDEQKTDKLCRIMEYSNRLSKATRAIGIQSDLSMDASILSPGKSVSHELVADGPRKVFAQVVMTKRLQPKEGGASIRIGDTILGEGDGAYIDISGPGKVDIQSVGDKPAEFLLFDMGPEEQ